MTLKEFAVLGGVKIIECGKGWKGKYGYTTADSTKSTYCGFKTDDDAYKHWLTGTFGGVAGQAVQKLLKVIK